MPRYRLFIHEHGTTSRILAYEYEADTYMDAIEAWENGYWPDEFWTDDEEFELEQASIEAWEEVNA